MPTARCCRGPRPCCTARRPSCGPLLSSPLRTRNLEASEASCVPRLPLRGMQTRSCRVHTTEAREVRFLLTDHSAFEVLGGQNAAQVLPEHTLCFFFFAQR